MRPSPIATAIATRAVVGPLAMPMDDAAVVDAAAAQETAGDVGRGFVTLRKLYAPGTLCKEYDRREVVEDGDSDASAASAIEAPAIPATPAPTPPQTAPTDGEASVEAKASQGSDEEAAPGGEPAPENPLVEAYRGFAREAHAGRLSVPSLFQCVDLAARGVVSNDRNGDAPDPLVGRHVRIFWPDDLAFYPGVVTERVASAEGASTAATHVVTYEDGSTETLDLRAETIRLALRPREAPELGGQGHTQNADASAPRAFEQGDVLWGKMKGFPPWPALVITAEEARLSYDVRLKGPLAADPDPIFVRFFGTYEFGVTQRVARSDRFVAPKPASGGGSGSGGPPSSGSGKKQAAIAPEYASKPYELWRFDTGARLGFQDKFKRVAFRRAVAEAHRYLKEAELPDLMLPLYNDAPGMDDEEGEELARKPSKRGAKAALPGWGEKSKFPMQVGKTLVVRALGAVAAEDGRYHDERFVYPIGFQSERTVLSRSGGEVIVHCEISRGGPGGGPAFKVTTDAGESFTETTALKAWARLSECGAIKSQSFSGHKLFGYSVPRVQRGIEALEGVEWCESYCGIDEDSLKALERRREAADDATRDAVARSKACWGILSQTPAALGFEPVQVKHRANACVVCDCVEETEHNQLMQCDLCKSLVHMGCDGTDRIPDGNRPWTCRTCTAFVKAGKPELAAKPACCLCPCAPSMASLLPTTDGRWTHAACAMWIPETIITAGGQVDNVLRIRPARLALKCGLCKVPRGPSIQCHVKTCFSAAHPLCARDAGWKMEIAEDEATGEVDLRATCLKCLRGGAGGAKAKRPREKERGRQREGRSEGDALSAPPEPEPAEQDVGECARTRPWRRDGEAGEGGFGGPPSRLTTQGHNAVPYVVGWGVSGARERKRGRLWRERAGLLPLEAPLGACAKERLLWANETVADRLAAGRSCIHGWGVFTKAAHKAGDFLVEYMGEVVRPSVANMREDVSYSHVGSGTYIFKLSDHAHIDATNVGNIAQWINHSCEPNAYSRVVSVDGTNRVVIAALVDIAQGEELTYDYRFSGDEILVCHCGSAKCRGTVNID